MKPSMNQCLAMALLVCANSVAWAQQGPYVVQTSLTSRINSASSRIMQVRRRANRHRSPALIKRITTCVTGLTNRTTVRTRIRIPTPRLSTIGWPQETASGPTPRI